MLIDFMAFVFGQVYHYMTMGIVQNRAFSLIWVDSVTTPRLTDLDSKGVHRDYWSSCGYDNMPQARR
jgi:hypothetical protein